LSNPLHLLVLIQVMLHACPRLHCPLHKEHVPTHAHINFNIKTQIAHSLRYKTIFISREQEKPESPYK